MALYPPSCQITHTSPFPCVHEKAEVSWADTQVGQSMTVHFPASLTRLQVLFSTVSPTFHPPSQPGPCQRLMLVLLSC